MYQKKQTVIPQRMNMKELPVSEQPYEKCLCHGAGCLSDAELLSVMIRTGACGERAVDLARRILQTLPEHSICGLFHASLEQLQQIRGIGKVKAVQLKCIAELSVRMAQSRMQQECLVCDHPEHVASYFMAQMRMLETEQVRLLILNGKNVLQREIVISEGSFNSSYASPREIFYNALKHKAVHILVLHNHPSGDPTPSREDVTLTHRLVQTGQLTGIPLIDHIVIGDNRYVSMKQNGLM